MYSEQLIARTIQYFRDAYDHHISAEQAQAYLDSFAGLFESVLNLKKHED